MNKRHEHLDELQGDAPPCFTPRTLKDMAMTRKSLQALFSWGLTERWPIRYCVICSNKPGVNGPGGDLTTFPASIRKQGHRRASRLRSCVRRSNPQPPQGLIVR